MNKEHKCIVEQDCKDFKFHLINERNEETKREKLIEIQERIKNCVYCQRIWWKFWAEQEDYRGELEEDYQDEEDYQNEEDYQDEED